MLTPADIELLKSVFATKEDFFLLSQNIERRFDRLEQTVEMIKDHVFHLDDEFFMHSKRLRRLEENTKTHTSS